MGGVLSVAAEECFEVGAALYGMNMHGQSIEWMQQAVERLDREEPTQFSPSKWQILDHMAFSHYQVSAERLPGLVQLSLRFINAITPLLVIISWQ